MKLIPITRDSVALIFVCIVVFGFFAAGLLNILDYFIIKSLLFVSFSGIVIIAINYAIKNDIKKKRPEVELQDDSH